MLERIDRQRIVQNKIQKLVAAVGLHVHWNFLCPRSLPENSVETFRSHYVFFFSLFSLYLLDYPFTFYTTPLTSNFAPFNPPFYPLLTGRREKEHALKSGKGPSSDNRGFPKFLLWLYWLQEKGGPYYVQVYQLEQLCYFNKGAVKRAPLKGANNNNKYCTLVRTYYFTYINPEQ